MSEQLSLPRLDGYTEFDGPLVFVVMDGIGLGKHDESNGVYLAYTPTMDKHLNGDLYCELRAHGTHVGMPTDDDMGNSEVGHNALGAGRIIAQGAKRVNIAIQNGEIFKSDAWKKAVDQAKNDGTLHFIGLLSDGMVHSHIDHVFAMLEQCDKKDVERVRMHILLDGRDVGERSALQYVEPLEKALAEYRDKGRDYKVASGGGRMVTTMDRYNADWSIVERGWHAHVLGDAREFASATEAIETFREEDEDVTDQYLPAFVVTENDKPVGAIEDGDAVIMFNFRGDRAIELTRAFEEKDFNKFDRKRYPDVFYAGMLEYDDEEHIPKNFLVEPPHIENPVSHYMCAAGITSYAISETQKFGHMTYFWNGNNAGYIDKKLETYEEVESDRVQFDQRPWMQGAPMTDKIIDAVKSGKHKFIRTNYPHGDMVGHTGNILAIRIAVETVDLCMSRLLPVVRRAKGIAILTADHGNADVMWTEKNGERSPHVAHTLNPVPFKILDYSGANNWELTDLPERGLSNVAATFLNLLGYEKPEDYNPSLIRLAR